MDKQMQHTLVCAELTDLYLAKNHDYGDSFNRTFDELGIISAVTRISDKVYRMQTLIQKEQKVTDETLRDVFIDTANYCIMTVMKMDADKNE